MDKPDLNDGLEWIWDAFFDLSGSRQLGFGVIGFIPINETLKFLTDWIGLTDREEIWEVVKMLKAMDSEYVRHFQGEAAKK